MDKFTLVSNFIKAEFRRAPKSSSINLPQKQFKHHCKVTPQNSLDLVSKSNAVRNASRANTGLCQKLPLYYSLCIDKIFVRIGYRWISLM